MLRYIAALLLVPLADAFLLVLVAAEIGPVLTVLVVVLTALLGMLLVRAEGRHTVRKIQQKLAEGEIPTDELLDGGLLLVAGALTLTPGLVTDALGIILVFPLTRIPIRAVVRDYVVVPHIDKKTGGFATGNVYLGGFPFDGEGSDAAGAGAGVDPGPGPGGFGGTGEAEDAYDLSEDAYEVEFEDEDDDGD
jgi:UPF0716 protein FxsA